MSDTVASLLEAGVALAETSYGIEGHNMTVTSLKTAQQVVKSTFRQFSSSWTRTRQLQEAWVKATALRRRAVQKLASAGAACLDAKERLEAAEGEHQEALGADEEERCSYMVCAKAVVEAEVQLSASEFEEAGQKCRRSECKAAIS